MADEPFLQHMAPLIVMKEVGLLVGRCLCDVDVARVTLRVFLKLKVVVVPAVGGTYRRCDYVFVWTDDSLP